MQDMPPRAKAAFAGASRRRMFSSSQPFGIPMRILTNISNNPGAQRIRDDVAADGNEVVMNAGGPVVKSRLPKRPGRDPCFTCPARGITFDHFNELGQLLLTPEFE